MFTVFIAFLKGEYICNAISGFDHFLGRAGQMYSISCSCHLLHDDVNTCLAAKKIAGSVLEWTLYTYPWLLLVYLFIYWQRTKCRCSSQGDQSSESFPSVDAYEKPRPKGMSQVSLSQVSMLTKSLVPRESVKSVFPKCRCLRKASSQGNQSSESFPSVDAYEKPRPKGISQVSLSQVSMLTKSLVPRESVKSVFPKCRCLRKASSQGNQSSESFPSVDAYEKPRPKGISQVSLSQVSMLTKSLVPRESVKLVFPKCRCLRKASSQGNQSSLSA